MIEWTIEERKKLVEIYPYLAPKNAWTGTLHKDYDYDHIHGEFDIPDGWQVLFYLYCKNIRSLLIEADYLNKFYFTQIKEKYGTLRLYNAGYPVNFDHITDVYESFSKYICLNCGKRSKWETAGWITYICQDCAAKHDYIELDNNYKVVHHRNCTIEIYDNKNDKYTKLIYSYKELKREYMKCCKMTKEKFYLYLIGEN